MTTPVINRVITQEQYMIEKLDRQTGSLMFPNDYWDCESYCDHDALKKTFGIKGKIVNVLVLMRNDPRFRNISNTSIKYTCPVLIEKDLAGAYRDEKATREFLAWITDHPVGDAIIVYKPSVASKKVAKKAAETEQAIKNGRCEVCIQRTPLNDNGYCEFCDN